MSGTPHRVSERLRCGGHWGYADGWYGYDRPTICPACPRLADCRRISGEDSYDRNRHKGSSDRTEGQPDLHPPVEIRSTPDV